MSNFKMISIKSVLSCNVTFINPYNTLFGLKSEKSEGNFSVLLGCVAAN